MRGHVRVPEATSAGSHDASRGPRPHRSLGHRARDALHTLLRLGRLKSCYVATPFGELHYYDSAPGTGEPPAVLVHGLGASSFSMLPLAALVRIHRRVVLPDLFHFAGLSRAQVDGLDTHGHVDALAELLAALGTGPVDVCGHSMGGGLSIYLALRVPSLVQSVALFNPGGFTHGFQALYEDIVSIDPERAARLYAAAIAPSPLMHSRPARIVGRRLLHRMLASDSVQAYMRTIRDEDYLDRKVGTVSCPTLLVWGEHDRFLQPAIAEHIRAVVDDVQAYWVEGASHMVPLEATYACYRLLTRFWDERVTKRRTLPPWLESVLPAPQVARGPKRVA